MRYSDCFEGCGGLAFVFNVLQAVLDWHPDCGAISANYFTVVCSILFVQRNESVLWLATFNLLGPFGTNQFSELERQVQTLGGIATCHADESMIKS